MAPETRARMKVTRTVLALSVAAGACGFSSRPATSVAPLAGRACPSSSDLRAAFLADSLTRGFDHLPPHSYVSYLLNGRIVAANLRQGSLKRYRAHAAGLEVFDRLIHGAVTDVRVYRPNEAPSQLGVCPGCWRSIRGQRSEDAD